MLLRVIAKNIGDVFLRHSVFQFAWPVVTILVWRYFSAKLLCKDCHCWIAEEDRHLLSARHRDKRGNYVRLQIPAGGQQNSLSLQCCWLPRIVELMNPHRYCYRVRSRPGIIGVQTSNNWLLMMSHLWHLFCTLVLFEWENIYLFKFLCSVPLADCLNIHRHFRQTPRIWNFIFCWSVYVHSFTDSDLSYTDSIVPSEIWLQLILSICSPFFYFALLVLIDQSGNGIFEWYNVVSVRQIWVNKRTHPYRSTKIKFHILGVRQKCRWIN